MPDTMVYSETLVVTHCWCGIALALPQTLYEHAHQDERDVYCPLGHVFVFRDTWKKKYEAEREERLGERRRHDATRSLLRAEERSHASTRGHLTRHRKRAQAGVCPCCNRTFQQLARHMANKHPDFVPEVVSA